MGELFIALFDSILKRPSEHDLRSTIGRAAAGLVRADALSKATGLSVSDSDVHKLRSQYEALGLIAAEGAVSTFGLFGKTYNQKYIVWTVTEKGRRYVVQTRAIPRVAISPEQISDSGS